MSEADRILDLHESRMDAMDGLTKSMDKNLTEITRILETFSHHEYRLDSHNDKLLDAAYRIDTLESNEDKNETLMRILNRIFIVGIPAMIAAIFAISGVVWYGIDPPKNNSMNIEQIEKLLQTYTQPKQQRKIKP
jgi:hypothetical protein